MEENQENFPHFGYHIFFNLDNSLKCDKRNTMYVKCKICPQDKKSLSVAMDSACNLKKHIQVIKFFFYFLFVCVKLT